MTPLPHANPVRWNLEHSYAQLPPIFHERCDPVPVRKPRMLAFNRPLADALGLEAQAADRPDSAAIFAGNQLPDGARPLAQAYAGHQFGHFTTLGDGRAILLGEQVTPTGERVDIQLKGSGPTPFSRGGDGRAPVGPMLREFIVSEAMHALGIPTTRGLAVVTTGETVMRAAPLPGAVLTRVAASHIRVGTFEWAAARGDQDELQALADYTLRRHDPECAGEGAPYLALLEGVIDRQAALVSKWLLVGFIHGVMNTDNMTLSGETIDYGPCAFLDAYDPRTVFSSIDHHGRYAYGNQAGIAQWNLARLAESLLPLLHPDPKQAVESANAAIHGFQATFERHRLAGLRAKLGLFTAEAGDAALAEGLLEWMQHSGADFTNTFRALSAEPRADDAPPADAEFAAWRAGWEARLARQPQSPVAARASMRAANPAVIPRNHNVEEALAAATQSGDMGPTERLLAVLAKPYDPAGDRSEFTAPPVDGGHAYQTF